MLYQLYLNYLKRGCYPKDDICNHILSKLEYAGNCLKCESKKKPEIKKVINLKKPITIKQVKEIFLKRFLAYTIPNYIKKVSILKEVSREDEEAIAEVKRAVMFLNKLPEDKKCFIYDRLDKLGWTRTGADLYYFNVFDYVPDWDVWIYPNEYSVFHLVINDYFYYWTYDGKIYFAYKIKDSLIRNLFLPFALILVEGKKFDYKFDYFMSPDELIAIDFEKLKKALPNKKGE